jgi:UDP-N-acetylmuramate dehydrogenase
MTANDRSTMMRRLNSHAKDLARFWTGRILWNSPMAQFSTLRIGGPAEAIIPVATVAALKRLMGWLKKNEIGWQVVGRGSNILVSDSGLAGVTILLEGEFKTMEKVAGQGEEPDEKRALIYAGAACLLPRLVAYCTSQGLSGLEFAVGIPGSLGGAIIMNAGAWGSAIGPLVESVALMDECGTLSTRKAESLAFSYRQAALPPRTILVGATLSLRAGDRADIKATCRQYQEKRRASQPTAEPSVGSFFKNPPGDSAGRLIEKAGLKGFAIGDARVSELHANFFINDGSASAADMLNLMHHVQETVYSRFRVRLEPEVRILGEE